MARPSKVGPPSGLLPTPFLGRHAPSLTPPAAARSSGRSSKSRLVRSKISQRQQIANNEFGVTQTVCLAELELHAAKHTARKTKQQSRRVPIPVRVAANSAGLRPPPDGTASCGRVRSSRGCYSYCGGGPLISYSHCYCSPRCPAGHSRRRRRRFRTAAAAPATAPAAAARASSGDGAALPGGQQ